MNVREGARLAVMGLALTGGLRAAGPVAGPPDEPAQARLAVTTLDDVEGQRLWLRDMDGDGRRDLVRFNARGATVHLLGDERVYGEEADLSLRWPAGDVAWDLADLEGDGVHELVLIVDGQTVLLSRATEGHDFAVPEVLLEGLTGSLPRGLRHMAAVRDVDGDGRADLVVPGPGRYLILLQDEQGAWSDPVTVGFQAEVSYRMGDPDRVDGRFAQTLMVPWFSMRDVDGDGRRDVVTQTDDVVQMHLARPELSTTPTWQIDLAAIRDTGPQRTGIDLDDLFSNLDERVTWRVADLDGQPPNDVLVQHGGTFRMWYGGAATGIDRDPDQVLKSSGNVLHTLVRDVLGDERPELQVIRGEKLSVGDIVRWLVVAGSLDFDVFTYANEGAGLSRKPARRSRISIEIPGLLELMDDAEGLGETMQERLETPARRLDLDGDGAVDDVVDVLDGHVVYYRDVVPEDFPTSLIESESLEPERSLDRLIELFILEDLDSLGDGATRTIQLEDAMDLDVTPGWRLRQLVAGTTPERRFKTPLLEPRLTPTDVDGDGVSDVVLRGHLEGDVQAVQVLISLP